MTAGLVLDLLIAGLLAAAVAYGAVLNRRLGRLRRDGAELKTVIGDLDAVVERAEAGIAALKAARGPVEARPLQGTAEGQARELTDDLRFLIERGEAVADRLEAAASRARPGYGSGSQSATAQSAGAFRAGGLAAALNGVR